LRALHRRVLHPRQERGEGGGGVDPGVGRAPRHLAGGGGARADRREVRGRRAGRRGGGGRGAGGGGVEGGLQGLLPQRDGGGGPGAEHRGPAGPAARGGAAGGQVVPEGLGVGRRRRGRARRRGRDGGGDLRHQGLPAVRQGRRVL